MKKAKTALLGVLVLLLTLPLSNTPARAAEYEIPTLFCNDEAWYKEAVSPLIVRDGEYYIPAEMCLMFDYIDVSTPKEYNLLITNMNTGEYISVLFMEQSAALNGKIIEGVGIFRDSGVYYIEAETVCGAVGLKCEYYVSDNGAVSLRLTDGNTKSTFDALIKKNYSAEPGDEDDPGEDDPVPGESKKVIYFVCTQSDPYTAFSANDILGEAGIPHTVFLNRKADVADVVNACLLGDYGIVQTGMADIKSADKIKTELDETNKRVSETTKIKTRFTLSSGDYEKDEYLSSKGYIVVTPDIYVNGGANANRLCSDILSYIGGHDSCVVLLEDCWNSRWVVDYINGLENRDFVISNLAYPD